MIPPPEHPAESERIQALRETGLSDSDTSSKYDKFVKLASFIADTPISLFTLIDSDRQWFRARHGLDAKETLRSVSFCGHAILNASMPLVVEDAIYDMRFCDNPLVVSDPGIRFYAGVPICQSKSKLPIGTICVIDKKPRTLSDGQIDALVALGKMLEEQLVYEVKILRIQKRNDDLSRLYDESKKLLNLARKQQSFKKTT